MEKTSHYKDTIPKLIDNMKTAVEQCLEIVSMNIDSELSDDKLHAVLKAKRMAAEDAEYYAKRIDSLEKEQNNENSDEPVELQSTNPAKRFSRKQQKD